MRSAVRVRSSALWTEAGPPGYGCRVDVFLPSQPLGSDAAGAKAGLPPRVPVVGGGGRSARVGLRVEMGPLRKSISVRLEEGVHARLRRQSLRSGVPTSALVRALVHRWLDEQDEVGSRLPGH
jgi:hypothetical protein